MIETVYVPTMGINEYQGEIMRFIDTWVRTEKTPVAKKEILKKMGKAGKKMDGVLYALQILIRKGYIRKANMASTNETYYVQLRSIKI